MYFCFCHELLCTFFEQNGTASRSRCERGLIMDSLPPPDAKSRIPASGEQEKHGVVTLKPGLYFAASKPFAIGSPFEVTSHSTEEDGGSPTPQASKSGTFPSIEYARQTARFPALGSGYPVSHRAGSWSNAFMISGELASDVGIAGHGPDSADRPSRQTTPLLDF
jgi:hypothetical protein